MKTEETITTRKLLRNFKEIKENLKKNNVEKYIVKVPEGKIVISLEHEKTQAERIIEAARQMPKDVEFKRYDNLWDEMGLDLINRAKNLRSE